MQDDNDEGDDDAEGEVGDKDFGTPFLPPSAAQPTAKMLKVPPPLQAVRRRKNRQQFSSN